MIDISFDSVLPLWPLLMICLCQNLYDLSGNSVTILVPEIHVYKHAVK